MRIDDEALEDMARLLDRRFTTFGSFTTDVLSVAIPGFHAENVRGSNKREKIRNSLLDSNGKTHLAPILSTLEKLTSFAENDELRVMARKLLETEKTPSLTKSDPNGASAPGKPDKRKEGRSNSGNVVADKSILLRQKVGISIVASVFSAIFIYYYFRPHPPVLNFPSRVDFRPVSKPQLAPDPDTGIWWVGSDMVVTLDMSYNPTESSSRISRVLWEEVVLRINGQENRFRWWRIVDLRKKSEGWLGDIGSAGPITIPFPEGLSREVMYKPYDKVLSWSNFFELFLNKKKVKEVEIELTSNVSEKKHIVSCRAGGVKIERKIRQYTDIKPKGSPPPYVTVDLTGCQRGDN